MEKISGCVEHTDMTEALSEILQDAKTKGMETDCDNVVRPTKCIWYRATQSLPVCIRMVPCSRPHCRKMIVYYFDERYIHTKTKEWTTDWIHCDIGVLRYAHYLASYSWQHSIFALIFLTNTAIWSTA